jgi:hypothetical protein
MIRFDRCLQIGTKWEIELESWMQKYFAKIAPGWSVIDSRHVHRDNDGDKFPDYVLYQDSTARYCFLDAKKRNVYQHQGHRVSFGFDQSFYHSYVNIAKKHETKFFVSFRDKNFDAQHWYLLDLDVPADFVWDYGNNGHGESICYRWYVDRLHKINLDIDQIDIIKTKEEYEKEQFV